MTKEDLKRESISVVEDIENKQKKLRKFSDLKRIQIEMTTKKIRERYEKKIIPLSQEINGLERVRMDLQKLCHDNGWCEIRHPLYGICSLCGFTRRPDSSGIGSQAHP